ncbi:MAG: serine/threonine protein kinase [Cyanobacteria bacterium]|nr:serine/threonine protein kinase [Cyanobacteriota bacterium]
MIRGLLFLSPLFIVFPLMQLVRAVVLPYMNAEVMSHELFYILMLLAPVFYLMALGRSYYRRVLVDNGFLRFGLFGRQKLDLTQLEEVAGDAGSYSNDFSESLVLKFKCGTELGLSLKQYEEEQVRSLLSELKRIAPDCKFTYADVIPLESRGLLKFLVNLSDAQSATLKLSNTPMEDLLVDLIKSHEKIFWILYCAFWCAIVLALSYYCVLFNASWAQHPGQPAVWGASDKAWELGQLYKTIQNTDPTNTLKLLYYQAAIYWQTTLDYFSGSGLAVVSIIWALFVGALAVIIPILRICSPKYVFIDPHSIGMGMKFIRWPDVRSIKLKKLGKMGDPLEGTVIIESFTYEPSVEVDLLRVAGTKSRQRILRLCDQYATDAMFDDDFMRTTNALVDIQFTDMWLADQAEETQADTDGGENIGEFQALKGGRYTVDSMLGFGGQGTTFMARLTESGSDIGTVGRQVVIKQLILPNYADVRILQDATNRFENGADLLKSLDHPQIVHLLEYFVEDGKAYLVMEFIPGKTLRQIVEDVGSLPLDQVMDLGLQICDILDYLHNREHPIIHCDLAPDNLILTPGGRIKLVDFDVARVLDSRAHSFIAGRPSYTPPEQFRGTPVVQSDIFAMGAILHYLKEGRDPPPLGVGPSPDNESELSEIDTAIRACVQFDAANRPQSAQEVRRLLQPVNDTCSVIDISIKESEPIVEM